MTVAGGAPYVPGPSPRPGAAEAANEMRVLALTHDNTSEAMNRTGSRRD